jgi:putative ABC transport system substrate-binding protein
MERRAFIGGLGALAAGWPLHAQAQPVVRNVGLWWATAQVEEFLPSYKRRLAELGWFEDRNVRFLVRTWSGDVPTMRQQAAELLATRPDLIVAASNPAIAMLKELGGRIPVVFVFVADPVGSGFVESLARPGGNITGFTNFEPTMGGK